jgi:hypothetical protein
MNYQYSIFLKILQIPFANFQSISPCLLSYFLSFSFYICFSLDAKLECSFSFWVCLCIFPPRSFIWRKRGKKSCKKKGKEERFWATQGQTPKPGLLARLLAGSKRLISLHESGTLEMEQIGSEKKNSYMISVLKSIHYINWIKIVIEVFNNICRLF